MALPLPEAEGTEEEALRLVAERACSSAGCVAAGITVVRGGVGLVVGTSLLGRRLEQDQWDAGQGPGLDAMRQLQVFNVACLVTATSWPEFVPLARSRGVRSSLAMPITLRGQALGALDLYSLDPEWFNGAEQLGLHYAGEAARVLSVHGPQPGGDLPHAGPLREVPGRSQAVS